MDAETSLDRPVVWRTSAPSAAELELVSRRIRSAHELVRAAQLRPPSAPAFLIVTPAGLRREAELERELSIRGVVVRERRPLLEWSRAVSILRGGAAGEAREMESGALAAALELEEVWRGLFPRDAAQLCILADDRSLERARAWRELLRRSVSGVQVTLQGLHDSRTFELEALHVPNSDAVEREWNALALALRLAA